VAAARAAAARAEGTVVVMGEARVVAELGAGGKEVVALAADLAADLAVAKVEEEWVVVMVVVAMVVATAVEVMVVVTVVTVGERAVGVMVAALAADWEERGSNLRTARIECAIR